MLHNLHIQNYALIENLDINFDSGFSVITGETGAGKSIILGAMALILGGRADTSAISPGAKRCTVEATFKIDNPDTTRFFTDNDLDFEDGECIIRREITATGKSRAFINDTPVSLSAVKQLSSRLIDIHSQHQNLLLNSNHFILDVTDSVADNAKLLNSYLVQYKAYRHCEQELQELKNRIETETDNLNFLQFQHKELSSANLTDGEQEELEEEQLILNNAESIKDAVYEASTNLNDCLDKIHSAHHVLERISKVYPSVESLAGRIDSCHIELDDINSELTYKLSGMDFDPERAETVNDRLNTIYSLLRKFHKTSVKELLKMQASLEQQLHDITNSADVLNDKQRQCNELRRQAEATAQKLTKKRQEASTKIENAITTQLHALGMPDVSLKVQISQTTDLQPTGADEVTFLFSSNKNMPLCNISKIASGGEIARVMLSLKALISTHKELPTIIFDEIDTGVSGKISDKMATVMNDMAQHGCQVICITHQPQIAAAGRHHFRVYKESHDGQAHTHIERLNQQMRIEEIAKMLSGEELTDAAISNAKTLLKL